MVRLPDGPLEEANIAKLFTLFDAAVEWLVSVGRTEQWGDVPWSKSEMRTKRVRGVAADKRLYGWFIEVSSHLHLFASRRLTWHAGLTDG